MTNIIDWAKEELNYLNKNNDEMQEEINKDILDIVKVFAEQGHSGFSASYTLSIIKRLLAWKPINPLTGKDDEWMEVLEWDQGNNFQQNKRCLAVFRSNFDNSTAYYTDGKVFSEDGGESWYTNYDSRVPVTFPFHVPDKPEYIILENTVELEDDGL